MKEVICNPTTGFHPIDYDTLEKGKGIFTGKRNRDPLYFLRLEGASCACRRKFFARIEGQLRWVECV